MLKRFLARGGGWVMTQMLLIPGMILAMLGARLINIDKSWPNWTHTPAYFGGGALLVTTSFLLTMSILHLGRNLTAFPKPLNNGTLVEHGVYAYIRHPIYTSIIVAILGLALLLNSTVGLAFAAGTFLFFDRKAAIEEKMLLAAYSGYADYRRRVRKLVPFIY
ncbi:MAG: isoprenylcysteine carboxylmethyltransferase family protein [Chloroflexi bacterium]|nr:isoprenylcysteine carboxylmethyltransferase family protein [Chloroflexota bacterium]